MTDSRAGQDAGRGIRVALVTGSAKRLGSAIAKALAAEGYALALHYNHSEADALALQKELEAGGCPTSIHQADLSSSEAIDRLAEELALSWGRLHVLVNSASIFSPVPLQDIEDESLDRFYQINAKAPLRLCQQLFPLLHDVDKAQVVNITDIYASYPLRNHIPYTMSKAALASLTKSLALEWAQYDIAVNAVAPGAALPPEGMDETGQAALLHKVPMGRFGGADSIARAVVALSKSEYVTGQTITVDGGRTLSI